MLLATIISTLRSTCWGKLIEHAILPGTALDLFYAWLDLHESGDLVYNPCGMEVVSLTSCWELWSGVSNLCLA